MSDENIWYKWFGLNKNPFSTSPLNKNQIDLFDKNQAWEIRHQPDEYTFEIIKRVYNDRDLIDRNEKKGILVSIHGLLSKAEWNMDPEH